MRESGRTGVFGLILLMSLACSTENPPQPQMPNSNALSPDDATKGWRLLFDGRTTKGWRNFGQPSISGKWKVIDGALVRTEDGAGDIITDEKFADFELSLDWRVREGGNSGLFYRATEAVDTIWHAAPEMQILDDANHADGKSPLTSAGANYALYPAPRGVVTPAGEWNTAGIVVRGNHVEHWLNGRKLFEYEFESADWKARVASSKFSQWPLFGKATEGHIGLQDHGDHVEFRNIRIRPLR